MSGPSLPGFLGLEDFYGPGDPNQIIFSEFIGRLVAAEDRQRERQAAEGCATCGKPVSMMVIERLPDLHEKVTFYCANHEP